MANGRTKTGRIQVEGAPEVADAGGINVGTSTGSDLQYKTSADILRTIVNTDEAQTLSDKVLAGPTISDYQEFTDQGLDPSSPSAGEVRVYSKAGVLYKKLPSGEVSELGSGGLTTVVVDNTDDGTTTEDGSHYLADTSTAAFTLNLPAGAAGDIIRFSDAAENFGTNALTISPAAGEAIDGYAADEDLVLDVDGAWVQLMWDGSKWALDSSLLTSVSNGEFPDGISTDTVSELTAGSGITVDGVLLKDGAFTATGDCSIVSADDAHFNLSSSGSSSCLISMSVPGTGNGIIRLTGAGNPDLRIWDGTNTDIFRISYAGACTITSSDYTALTVKRSSAGSGAAIKLENGDSNYWAVSCEGNEKFAINYNSTLATVAQATCTNAGSWEIGPASYTGTHTVNGRIVANGGPSGNSHRFRGDNSAVTGAAYFINSNVADAAPGIAISVGSADTSVANKYVNFYRNDTQSTGGAIGASGTNGATFTTTSDIRLKENIQPLQGSLQEILKLNPVSFSYKKEHYPHAQDTDIGFIAQELEQVYPDAVSYTGPDREDAYKEIGGWDKTSARLVKAIQELSSKLDEANARIAALETK